MKKIFAFLCFLFAGMAAFSQGKLEEVVYLKNGTAIRGTILEYVPNVSIKIKNGRDLTQYKLDEIEKITREKLLPYANRFETKTKGYYGIAQVGLTYFPVDAGLPMASLAIINGYQFNKIFSLGLGVGVDISRKNIYNVPVFMDARVNFLKSNITPFFATGFGYNLHISPQSFYGSGTNISHGMVVHPAFGICIATTSKTAVSLAAGYKLLVVKRIIQFYPDAFLLSHAFTFTLGIHF